MSHRFLALTCRLLFGLMSVLATAHARAAEPLGDLKGHDGSVRSLQFSPDGKKLLTVGYNYDVLVWDLAQKTSVAILDAARKHNGDARFAWNGTAVIADARNRDGKTYETQAIDANTGKVIAIVPGRLAASSPSGIVVVSRPGKDKDQLCIADLKTGKEILSSPRELPNEAVAVTLDGKTVAVGVGETVQLFDVASGKERPGLQGLNKVSAFSFSPDGKWLVCTESHSTSLWNVGHEAGHPRFEWREGYNLWSHAPFSPDGNSLLVGFYKHPVNQRYFNAILDLTTRKPRALMNAGSPAVFSADGKSPPNNRFRFISLLQSPDGKSYAAALPAQGPGTKERVVLVNGESNQVIAEVGGGGRMSFFAFSQDGKLLAYADRDTSKVKLWDVSAGKEVPTATENAANALMIGDKGRAIGTVWGKKLYVYEVSSGRLLKELDLTKGHAGEVTGVMLSPSAAVFASCDSRGDVLLRDLSTGDAIKRFTAHKDEVLAAGFSGDGKLLVTLGKDMLVKVWQLEP